MTIVTIGRRSDMSTCKTRVNPETLVFPSRWTKVTTTLIMFYDFIAGSLDVWDDCEPESLD